eukprot:g56738.t1
MVEDCSYTSGVDTGRTCVSLLLLEGNGNGQAVDNNQKTSKWRPKIDNISASVPAYTQAGSVPLVVFKTSCEGEFVFFPTTSYQRWAGFGKYFESALYRIAESLYALANARRIHEGEAELDPFTFGHMYMPNPGLVFSILNNNGTTFVAPDEISSPYHELYSAWNKGKVRDSSDWTGHRYIEMPETCSYESWKKTGKCVMKWDGLAKILGGLNSNMDLSLLAEMESCNTLSGFPSLTLSCLGSTCADMFEVLDNKFCTQNSDCPNNLVCQEAPDFPVIWGYNWGYELAGGYYEITCTGYDPTSLATKENLYGGLHQFLKNVSESHRRKWGMVRSFPYKFTVQKSNDKFVITVLPQTNKCEYIDGDKECLDCDDNSCSSEVLDSPLCVPGGAPQCQDFTEKEAKGKASRLDEKACFDAFEKYGNPTCSWVGLSYRGWNNNYVSTADCHNSETSDSEVPQHDCPLAKFAYAFVQTGILKEYLGESTICSKAEQKTELPICTNHEYELDCGEYKDTCSSQKKTNIDWMNMFHKVTGKPLLADTAVNNAMNGFCFIKVDTSQAEEYLNGDVVYTDILNQQGDITSVKIKIKDIHPFPPVPDVDACLSNTCPSGNICEDTKAPLPDYDNNRGYSCICPPGASCAALTCEFLKRVGAPGPSTAEGCGDCKQGYRPFNADSSTKTACIIDDRNGCVANPCNAAQGYVCYDCTYSNSASPLTSQVNCPEGQYFYQDNARTCICPPGAACNTATTTTTTTQPTADCAANKRKVNTLNKGTGNTQNLKDCFPTDLIGCGCCLDNHEPDSNGDCKESLGNTGGAATLVPWLNALWPLLLVIFFRP